MIRGAVVVPAAFDPRPILPAVDPWSAAAQPGSAPRATEWAAHARRSRFLGPIPVGAGILATLLIGGIATAWFEATPVPVPTSAPTLSEPVEAVDLRVGDCFDVELPTIEEYIGLTQRACSEAHRYEVYWTGSMPGSGYPSDEAFAAFHDAHCLDTFGAYVGESWTETRLDSFWMVPTQDDWAAGYRSIQCSVCDPANPRLTYSLKGASPSGNGAIPL